MSCETFLRIAPFISFFFLCFVLLPYFFCSGIVYFLIESRFLVRDKSREL